MKNYRGMTLTLNHERTAALVDIDEFFSAEEIEHLITIFMQLRASMLPLAVDERPPETVMH